MKRYFLLLLSCSLCHCVPQHLYPEVNRGITVESERADYENACMTLTGHVVVDHPLIGRLHADHALIREPGKGDKVGKHTLPGSIALAANPDQGICQLETPDGKYIQATHIDIDTTTHHLVMENPRGHMAITRGREVLKQQLDFSAGHLVWEEPFHVMTLSDHVVFNQGDMGTLVTDSEVEVRERIEGTKRILTTITSRGKTILNYLGTGETAHMLTAYGGVCVNHEEMRILFTSPENMQVHFKDNFGEFFSDQAAIEYEVVSSQIRPVKLLLSGHVHVRNQFARVESAQNPLVQYAMADQIEYSLKTREIVLSAHKGQRVLFYDKLNNVQVSAPALRMKRDPKTHQDSIKGEGDVRFTFVKQELDKLQNYFDR